MAYEQCDQTLADFVATVAVRLTDYEAGHEFTTWTEDLLTGYLNSALAWLSLFRPDKFTVEKTHALKSGCNIQTTPCDNFTGVLRTVGACGTQRPPSRTSAAQGKVLGRLPQIGCKSANSPCGDYVVNSYHFDPDNPGSFYVYPVPPVGCDTSIIVGCTEVPCYGWDGDSDVAVAIPAQYTQIIEEYVLYLALSKDIESAANREQAKVHYASASAAISGGKKGSYSQYQPNIFTVGVKDDPKLVR